MIYSNIISKKSGMQFNASSNASICCPKPLLMDLDKSCRDHKIDIFKYFLPIMELDAELKEVVEGEKGGEE